MDKGGWGGLQVKAVQEIMLSICSLPISALSSSYIMRDPLKHYR